MQTGPQICYLRGYQHCLMPHLSNLYSTLFSLLWPVLAILLIYRFWKPVAGSRRSLIWLAAAPVTWDCALAYSLPWLGLSYGPQAFTQILLVSASLLAGAGLAVIWRLANRLLSSRLHPATGLALLALTQLALIGCQVDAFLIEPFDLHITHVELPGPVLAVGRPVRIVHLSDLHVERLTRRERDLVTQVQALQPDLIVLTGDYPNIDYNRDAQTLADTRWLLSQLSAPLGVYAITGTPYVDVPAFIPALFEGLDNIVLLQNEIYPVSLGDQKLYLIGISNTRLQEDAATLHRLRPSAPPGAYTLLLYHTPDLIEYASQENINLYLAGHTHNGQINLPWIGPLVTGSRYGKQYVSGLHFLGGTAEYTSRGIGMEGLGLPRLRFVNNPPEIVFFELTASQK